MLGPLVSTPLDLAQPSCNTLTIYSQYSQTSAQCILMPIMPAHNLSLNLQLDLQDLVRLSPGKIKGPNNLTTLNQTIAQTYGTSLCSKESFSHAQDTRNIKRICNCETFELCNVRVYILTRVSMYTRTLHSSNVSQLHILLMLRVSWA